MPDLTRGEFLGLGAALAAGLGAGCTDTLGGAGAARAAAASVPELVVVNSRVITIDDRLPEAEAFAVQDGRFLAVGRSAEIRALAAAGRTEVIDAAGMTVTPGFIDAHSHPSGAGLAEIRNVNCNLGSIARIKAALRERAARTPKGEWVIGFMYDDTRLEEGRPLNRRDLDEVVPDHPVVVGHRGGHTGVYNSLAFRLAGVTKSTPDPEGGRFYHDDDGELSGKVAERARGVFSRLLPGGSTRDERQAGIARISQLMCAAGLTSVHQTGTSVDDLVAYQDAAAAGELRFRAYLLPRGGLYDHLTAAGLRTGFGDPLVRIGAVKFSADGSASERTMRMSTPYVGRPDDFGILTMSQEEIHEAVEQAHRNGWQIGIHANGDVTIDMVLNAYERVQRMWPRPDPRHRIEHCSLVNPELIRRIRAAGVIPTPFYTYAHYHGDKWVEYGPEKMEWMFAHRSLLDAGITVGPASDFMPGPYEPMMALQSLVTRKDEKGRVWGPSQRITIEEALRLCTLHGAYASFEEHLKGSITPGKLADFVLLGADPRETDPDRLKEIPIIRTVLGGRTVHEA